MMNESVPILKVRGLSVDFPVFGGILQKQVDSVHAVKDLNIDMVKGSMIHKIVTFVIMIKITKFFFL